MSDERPSNQKLDCCPPGTTKEQQTDVLERLRHIHRLMHAGKSYGFEQTILCDTVREVETLRCALKDTQAVLAAANKVLQEERATRETSATLSIEHQVGKVAFRYIDRLNDQTPDDNAEKIVGEMLAELTPILTAHFDQGLG